MNVVIETDRLFFRKFTADDRDLIFELNRDPEVTRYTCDPVFDLEQAKKILNEIILHQYAAYHYGRWATFLKPNLEFIGWCGLKCRPDRNEIDLGYRFMKKFWGKGYATEAASACLRYGFTELQVQKIIGRALPANHASIKVLEKCGMHYDGEEIVDGHLHKTYYSINPAVQP